ncbi:hypothetical protein A1OS_12930 [Enterovibrio norvegicus]|uniref:UPF0319 protein SAMN03084138_04324 n=1 Tax=Enterovibrio norvegicus DSM 15893 TaxID=1121869 RepID=A0A1I5WI98_9GAMM|nr:DUF2057 domain-containing protein [Enterovibrio norvegicus]OEE68557.1 hypothetical protein A1OS_12930 [Enterovibrio norvegicus]SFQ19504.1 hypothetical protein SAMN03084138_04324 [Enterovibrio norvegicus DSM 15893]
MKVIVFFCAFIFSSSMVVASEIEVGAGLQVLVLNGNKVEANSGETLSLNNGDNQLVVRYKSILDQGSKTKLFESKPYVFQFTDIGKDLSISIERFRKYIKAERAFEKGKVSWSIENSAGKNIRFHVDVLPGNPGLFPYGDLPKAVSVYNKNNGIYFDGQEIKDLNEEVVVAVSKTGDVELTGDALAQLKLWYTKATKEERKTFRKWMIDQE